MSGNPGYVCWGWLNTRHQPRRLPRQGVPVVKSKLKPCEGGEPFSCEGLGKPRGFVAFFFEFGMLQFCSVAKRL